MSAWEYATIAIDRTDGAKWVARSQGHVLAMGKRITEVVEQLCASHWELVDLSGTGAHLQRPARIDLGALHGSHSAA